MKNVAAAPTVQRTARGIERLRVVGLLGDRGRRLEADEQQDAEQHPAEDAAVGEAEQRGLAGVEHRQRVAAVTALGDDHDAERHHRDEREPGEREHRADRDAHPQVVEDQHEADADQPEDPPRRRAGRGDVGDPEPVHQDPKAEEDAAAAEEQRAGEVDARGEDPDRRVGAACQVLVHRAGARVLAGELRDHVADREHAQRRDHDRQRRVPAGAELRARDAALDQREREHRPDRERLSDGVDRGESALTESARLGCGHVPSLRCARRTVLP